jgi:undecaprenyl-diphosphatase
MDLFQAIILGVVQGDTEYIPVSSSAHLMIVPWLLGWPDAPFEFEVLVQWGTLVGVFVYFWRDIWAIITGVLQGLLRRDPFGMPEARLGWLVVLATLPVVVVGLTLKDYFKAAFGEPVFAGGLLIFNALLLTIAEYYGGAAVERLNGGRELDELSWLDAVVIGFWQSAAVLPGISRSGATISGGVLRRLSRTEAARFSFLMSIPALLGAGVVALKDLLEAGTLMAQLPAISIGFVVAAVSGYLCIRWLLHYLQRHSLYAFAGYCIVVSLITITVYLVGG